MSQTTDNLRIASIRPLISPALLMEQLPLSNEDNSFINQSRRTISNILCANDPRLLVIVGPCSIHDTDAAKEYGQRIAKLRAQFKNQLEVVMRVYFEKPRTTVGWKGLINDPQLDGSYDINRGLHQARSLLLELNKSRIPTATEFLDTIIPQFISDLISWGAIGARTTESQIHRELASGLSMPVGFKNGTDGNIQIAIDAISSAHHPHHFLSVTKQGIAAIVNTQGNPDTHIILRGAKHTTNYDERSILETKCLLDKAGIQSGIMVDCSHGNSQKKYTQQARVVDSICHQIERGAQHIHGVMLESHLKAGNQSLSDRTKLVYGQSITDACIDIKETAMLLEQLASSVKNARLSWRKTA